MGVTQQWTSNSSLFHCRLGAQPSSRPATFKLYFYWTNLQLHCFLRLVALLRCSFFSLLDRPCKTLQMLQVAHKCKNRFSAQKQPTNIQMSGHVKSIERDRNGRYFSARISGDKTTMVNVACLFSPTRLVWNNRMVNKAR